MQTIVYIYIFNDIEYIHQYLVIYFMDINSQI